MSLTNPTTPNKRPIELLAPAKDAATAREAILHGADAVYIGGPSHGARAQAGNSLDDIRAVCRAAHPFGVRVYVTLNTLVYEHELRDVERLVWDLWCAGVDALIVQDMALTQMHLPPIDLHASTQCDVRDGRRAQVLHDAGFSQIVVARELSLEEMAAIHRAVPGAVIEAFVHGALCVSFSGDCRAGQVTRSRSANRGECPQLCRLPYDLVDGEGKTIVHAKHLLSLRDLNRSASLQALLDAGVSSLKIEGRLKDAAYVKNTVAAYRRELDRIISSHPDRYRRASQGVEMISFTPDLRRSFNRGFTGYFTAGSAPKGGMASIDTPKWAGMAVGKITGKGRGYLSASLTEQLNNGDGLGYFDRDGVFCGFRVNRVEGNRLFPARPVDPPVGCTLYRNADRRWDRTLEADTARRIIPVRMTLRAIGDTRLALMIADSSGHRVELTADAALAPSRTPQEEVRARVLSKLGDTPLSIDGTDGITDTVGALFVPTSVLTDLRRRACDRFKAALRTTYHPRYRLPSMRHEPMAAVEGDYCDNVANSLARRFYTDRGIARPRTAIEVKAPRAGQPVEVMHTRYCLRRELGRCLLSEEGRKWREPLTLVSGRDKFRVQFHCSADCSACGMTLVSQ